MNEFISKGVGSHIEPSEVPLSLTVYFLEMHVTALVEVLVVLSSGVYIEGITPVDGGNGGSWAVVTNSSNLVAASSCLELGEILVFGSDEG